MIAYLKALGEELSKAHQKQVYFQVIKRNNFFKNDVSSLQYVGYLNILLEKRKENVSRTVFGCLWPTKYF